MTLALSGRGLTGLAAGSTFAVSLGSGGEGAWGGIPVVPKACPLGR